MSSTPSRTTTKRSGSIPRTRSLSATVAVRTTTRASGSRHRGLRPVYPARSQGRQQLLRARHLNLYAGALPKALEDFDQASTLDPNDAYATLWRRIVATRSNLPSRLPQAVARIDMTKWPAPVIRLFLGQLAGGPCSSPPMIATRKRKKDRSVRPISTAQNWPCSRTRRMKRFVMLVAMDSAVEIFRVERRAEFGRSAQLLNHSLSEMRRGRAAWQLPLPPHAQQRHIGMVVVAGDGRGRAIPDAIRP